MSSSEQWPLLNLGERLVTTQDDVEALRRARRSPPMSPEEFVEFLSAFAVSTEALRGRRGPQGPEPFSLFRSIS